MLQAVLVLTAIFLRNIPHCPRTCIAKNSAGGGPASAKQPTRRVLQRVCPRETAVVVRLRISCQFLLKGLRCRKTPRYLLQDRDETYGEKFSGAARWLGIRDVLTEPQSPWQIAYVERWIAK